MLYGAPAGGIFEYFAGAFNGNGIDRGGNDDTSIMGIGRVAVNPLHPVPYDETPSLRGAVPFRFAVGLNGIADRAHPTKQQTNTTTGATETVPLPPRRACPWEVTSPCSGIASPSSARAICAACTWTAAA